MQVLASVRDLRAAIAAARAASPGALGLVPTMGALHVGHLSLVERARTECSVVVGTIFVNPTQFAPGEDFERYPRQQEQDFALFAEARVDLVFAPPVEEIYTADATSYVDVGELGTRLDGAFRPGHFRGVATVVTKLLHIAQPDRAYFGQKDAAQVAVLRRMVRDLNWNVELVACPILREADGLAMSSRNVYLSAEERANALVLPRTLQALHDRIAVGEVDASRLLAEGRELLRTSPGIDFEFLEAVDADTLYPVERVRVGTLFALAAKVGKTRLIDNFVVEAEVKGEVV